MQSDRFSPRDDPDHKDFAGAADAGAAGGAAPRKALAVKAATRKVKPPRSPKTGADKSVKTANP